MYNRFQLAKKYVRYYCTAANGKGHGIHSPFVFDFIKNVLRDSYPYTYYNQIEMVRRELISNTQLITMEDFGAGSSIKTNRVRSIHDIARTSLKTKKYTQLLFRIVNYYQPQTILELGTSLGITTSYLASGNIHAKVFTCEGATAVADIAKKIFKEQRLTNIELWQGEFDKTLPELLSQVGVLSLVFIDGNHRKEPTLRYFQQLLKYANIDTIFIFDDIHWSKEMEEAWQEIKQHPSVTLSIDLFFIGIIFFRADFKKKQHFTIRF